MKTVGLSIPITAGAAVSFTKRLPEHGEGFALAVKINCPNTSAATYTINIYDLDGDLLFTKAALAENSVVQIYARTELKEIVCHAGASVNLTFNVAPDLADTVDLTFYMA
jgi:hypothetical protein